MRTRSHATVRVQSDKLTEYAIDEAIDIGMTRLSYEGKMHLVNVSLFSRIDGEIFVTVIAEPFTSAEEVQ